MSMKISILVQLMRHLVLLFFLFLYVQQKHWRQRDHYIVQSLWICPQVSNVLTLLVGGGGAFKIYQLASYQERRNKVIDRIKVGQFFKEYYETQLYSPEADTVSRHMIFYYYFLTSSSAHQMGRHITLLSRNASNRKRINSERAPPRLLAI